MNCALYDVVMSLVRFDETRFGSDIIVIYYMYLVE